MFTANGYRLQNVYSEPKKGISLKKKKLWGENLQQEEKCDFASAINSTHSDPESSVFFLIQQSRFSEPYTYIKI